MNLHCKLRAHCRMCRTNPTVRKSLGFPEVCPHGITAETLPQPTERDRALQAAARGEVYAPPGRCKGCGG
jgi:hypothetical protein